MGGLVMFRRVFFFEKFYYRIHFQKRQSRSFASFKINAFFFFSTRKNMKECPVASVKASSTFGFFPQWFSSP